MWVETNIARKNTLSPSDFGSWKVWGTNGCHPLASASAAAWSFLLCTSLASGSLHMRCIFLDSSPQAHRTLSRSAWVLYSVVLVAFLTLRTHPKPWIQNCILLRLCIHQRSALSLALNIMRLTGLMMRIDRAFDSIECCQTLKCLRAAKWRVPGAGLSRVCYKPPPNLKSSDLSIILSSGSLPGNPTPVENERLRRQSSIVISMYHDNLEKKHNPRLSGWRAGILSCSLTAFGVLIINLILMIWAIAKHKLDAGYGILYAGNCGQTRTINATLHILINILSAVLLSASNYTI